MRILIVEDEHRIAGFLARGLDEEGFTVEVRGDGETGLDAALSTELDLIVLDLMLPGLDGMEFLRTYRTRGGTAPVLVLTARDSLDDKVDGFEAGADDYLTKPFAFEELLARVRALTRRRALRPTPVFDFAGVSLDPVSRSVTRNGRPIELSPREFALLSYFLRHPETALSRTRLFESVWASRYDGISNVVDVYVNYLRRKLEERGEPRLIHTLRGHGYVLRRPAG